MISNWWIFMLPNPTKFSIYTRQYQTLTFPNSPVRGTRTRPFGRLCFTPFRIKIIPSDGASSTLPYCLQPSHKRNILQRQNKPFVEFYSRQLGLSWDRTNTILLLPLPQGGKKCSKPTSTIGETVLASYHTIISPQKVSVAPDG